MVARVIVAFLSLPDADTIRRKSEEVIARPEYQTAPQSEGRSMIVDMLMRLLYWILKPLRWLFEAMEGLPDFLRWLIVVGLVVLLVLLIAHITISIVSALSSGANQRSMRLSDIDETPDPAHLEQLASEAVARGDYIAAVRHLFRACLIRLQDTQNQRFRPGMTNREYLRRFRSAPFVDSLRQFVELIDNCWYGDRTCREQDYESCRSAYSRIRQELSEAARLKKEAAHAHGS